MSPAGRIRPPPIPAPSFPNPFHPMSDRRPPPSSSTASSGASSDPSAGDDTADAPDDAPVDAASDGPLASAPEPEEDRFAVRRRWRPRGGAPAPGRPGTEAADAPGAASEDRAPERDDGETGPGGDPAAGASSADAPSARSSGSRATTGPDPAAADPTAADPTAADAGDADAADADAGDGDGLTSDAASSATGPPDAAAPETPDERNGEEAQPDPAEPEADGRRGADADEETWADWLRENEQDPAEAGSQPDSDRDLYTDRRHTPAADRIEEEIQEQTDRRNRGDANTDWTPDERKDRKTAALFALLVSKVAEDISYQRAPGDRFWDPRKIMRRQIDRRPLSHCKMDYTKRRLALLVDTSPSCRDEAVFYSKIASGAMLRDDIDLLLCPNGRVDARFDRDEMRFVSDDRGTDWALDGRTVLYFTDWDGADEIVEHARTCTLYWFDNCDPDAYWHSSRERRQQVRLQFRGRHFHCPDRESFLPLVRKIRP